MSAFRVFRLLVLLLLLFWRGAGWSSDRAAFGGSGGVPRYLNWLIDSPGVWIYAGITLFADRDDSPAAPNSSECSPALLREGDVNECEREIRTALPAASVHLRFGGREGWRRSDVGLSGEGILGVPQTRGVEE